MRRTQSALVARSSLAHSLALCLDKKTHAETRNIMKRKARSGKGFHRRIHAYRVLNCTRMRGGGNRVMCGNVQALVSELCTNDENVTRRTTIMQ